MKFKYLFLALCFILFTKDLEATNYYEKNELKLLQKKLFNIQEELKNVKNTKEKILKLYISLFLYKNIKTKLIKDNQNKENYLEVFKNYEDIYLFQKFLLNSLLKSLIEKEEELKEKERYYLSKITQLRKKETNTIKKDSEEYLNFIKSPINGNIKQINFTENKIALTIEGDKCKAHITGIEVLKVNLGDYVKKGDIIGENLSKKERPKISTKCD